MSEEPGILLDDTRSPKSSISDQLKAYLVDDNDTSELQDGNPLRVFHDGSPLCFDLDHFVHRQGVSDDFLTQSIAMSQSIFRVTVQEVKVTPLALLRFYNKRNPEKCSDVPAICEKFGDDPRKLLQGLKTKYGSLDPRELSTQTVWRLQSTMSGTYLTSALVNHPQATSVSYLKAHETTGVAPGAKESFIIESTAEPTYFRIRVSGAGYLVVESRTGYVSTAGSQATASKFQFMSPGFQRPNFDSMLKSDKYRKNYDHTINAMAKSIITNEAAAAAAAAAAHVARENEASRLLLAAEEPASPDDDWEIVEMTEKMTDDAMTVSTFEYQRRYPFQGWLPLMLPTDPPAWSDETGRMYLPLSSFNDSKGWMWTTDWAVDLFRYQDEEHTAGSGRYTGETTAIGSIASAASHHIDSAGWEYANGFAPTSGAKSAEGPEESTGAGFRFGPKQKLSLLRRRKWIRRRCKVQEFEQSMYQSQHIFGTLGQAAQHNSRHAEKDHTKTAGKARPGEQLKQKARQTLEGFKSGMKNFWGAMTTTFKPATSTTENVSSKTAQPQARHSPQAHREPAERSSSSNSPRGPVSTTPVPSDEAVQSGDVDQAGVESAPPQQSTKFVSAADLRRTAKDLLKQRRYEEALEAANAAVDADGSAGSAFLLRAAAKLELGEIVMALTDANYCINLQPNAAAGHLLKAQALYRLQQYDRALDVTRTCLNLVDETLEGDASPDNETGDVTEVKRSATRLLSRLAKKLPSRSDNVEGPSDDSTHSTISEHVLEQEETLDNQQGVILNAPPSINDTDMDVAHDGSDPDLNKDTADVDMTATISMRPPSPFEMSESLYESFYSANGDGDSSSGSDDDLTPNTPDMSFL